MKMRPKTEELVRNIMDVMSGADGGAGFYAFQGLVEDMDQKAAKGDKAAADLLVVIQRFSKLLDTARKYYLR